MQKRDQTDDPVLRNSTYLMLPQLRVIGLSWNCTSYFFILIDIIFKFKYKFVLQDLAGALSALMFKLFFWNFKKVNLYFKFLHHWYWPWISKHSTNFLGRRRWGFSHIQKHRLSNVYCVGAGSLIALCFIVCLLRKKRLHNFEKYWNWIICTVS
jgi:hypothetical protein